MLLQANHLKVYIIIQLEMERLFIKESLNSKKCIWESQQNGLQKLQNWQKEMTF